MLLEIRWFSARLLFESLHDGDPNDDALFEDRFVLIRADVDDETQAIARAEAYGRAEGREYRAAAGNLVRVRFVQVRDVQEIDDSTLVENSETYHHFLNRDEATRLIASLEPGSLGNERIAERT